MNLSKLIVQKLKISNRQVLVNFLRCYSAASAHVSNNKEDLVVKFGGNDEHFPLVWLRDNCRCENCFHPGSHSRIINWNNFNVDVKIKSVETTERDNSVIINWHDNHKSKFSFEWLKQRSFTKENQEKFVNYNYRLSKILWNGNKFLEVKKKYDYEDVMNNNETFYNWLEALARYGVSFMENAPTDKNECHRLANKIAFIRKTHYGDDFHVVAKPGTSNVAYLSSLLQLHTDLPYYDYQPGVTILHCIEQTQGEGGENLLTDVFYVAEKLRRENKKIFDILSTVDVNWLDVGEEDGVKYHKIFRGPMICLDSEGNVEAVRHSIPQRDSHFTVDLKYVKPWYEALRIFVDLINIHACKFKTKPGEIFAFDNIRLVHGRLSYEDTAQNQRFIVGFYVDWDEIYSKMRVLKQSIKN